MVDDLHYIRQALQRTPNLKWGFVIYRCTYDDDDQWKRFMDHLNTRVRLQLGEEDAAELFERIDWDVQEDREALDGVSSGEVRK